MLEHFLDHLPWNPLWWELIFVTLLVVIALAPIGRHKRGSKRSRPGDGGGSVRGSE